MATFNPAAQSFRAIEVDEPTHVSLPKPQVFSAPVLIGDCATPLAGETVLSLLLRRLDLTDHDDAP